MGVGYFGSKRMSADLYVYAGGYKIEDTLAKDLGYSIYLFHLFYARIKRELVRIKIKLGRYDEN